MVCSVEGCGKPRLARGLCDGHYARLRKKGILGGTLRPYTPRGGCEVGGCDEPADARDLCKKHYMRERRHGDPASVLPIQPLVTPLATPARTRASGRSMAVLETTHVPTVAAPPRTGLTTISTPTRSYGHPAPRLLDQPGPLPAALPYLSQTVRRPVIQLRKVAV